MNLLHTNTPPKGRFYLETEDGTFAGEMTYSWAGTKKFIIDHTHVEPAFGGQGLGKRMVLAAVAYARENELKIIPLCPFAKSVFDKEAEIRDVVF